MSKEPIYELAFSAGIDQSQRPEVLDPRSGWLALKNGRQNKRGGYDKRKGFAAQTLARLDADDGSRAAGYRIFAHDKQTCVIDGTPRLESYSTAVARNVPAGRVPDCALEMVPMPALGQAGGSEMDGIRCGNYYVRAYVAGYPATTDIYATVVDIQTGTVIRAPELIGTTAGDNAQVMLATYGDHVFAFYGGEGLAENTQYSYISTTSAATLTTGWSAGAVAMSDCADASNFSVCSLSDKVAIAYTNDSGGTSRVSIATLTIAGSTASTTVNTNSTTARWVALQGSSSGTLWVAWNESTAVRLQGRNPSTISTITATAATVITLSSGGAGGLEHAIDICLSSTANTVRVFANDGSGDRMHARGANISAGAVATTTAQATVYNARRHGRPFRIGTRFFALCSDWSTTTRAAIVCDLSESDAWVRPVACIAPALAAGNTRAQASIESDGTTVHVPVTLLSANEFNLGAMTAKLDFASVHRWAPVRHAGKTFLSGGVLSVYDGMSVTESGFLMRPATPTATDSGGGSGPTGTFRYVCTFEQVDKSGTWHVSSVSDPSTITGTITDNTVTVTVRPISISSRILTATDPGVRIGIYRTASGGSPPYYFVDSVDNDLTAATLTYGDATPDNILTTQEKLYAPSLPGVDGSAQDRRPPPGLTHLESYNGMLVGAQGETLWYSGQDVEGEGTWFSPIFQVPVSGDGPITGLKAQDGTLYVFKRTAIYAIAGEPPSDNGAAGGLGVPRRLAVDVGCTDARSLVVTSAGIFFRSEHTISLLTRGGQSVDPIGEKIQDTLADFPYVCSATLDSRDALVYFELSTTSGLLSGGSVAAVFDLTLGVWISIDDRFSYAGNPNFRSVSAAVVWNGSAYRYAWLGADGRVFVEQDTHVETGSGTAWITKYARSGWVHVAGLQGQQVIDRVLLLAEQETDHDIAIGVANDYDDSTFDTKEYDSDKLAALTTMWLDRDILQSTGQAVMVELEDATPTGDADTVGTGEGGTWVALTFSGEPKSGVKRTAYTHRGGS